MAWAEDDIVKMFIVVEIVLLILLLLPQFIGISQIQKLFCRLWSIKLFQRAFYGATLILTILCVLSYQRLLTIHGKYKDGKKQGTLQGNKKIFFRIIFFIFADVVKIQKKELQSSS